MSGNLVPENSGCISHCLFSRTFLLTTILEHEVDFVSLLDDGPCGAQQYVCKNGKCIDLTSRCDGKSDCLDDEQDCGTLRKNIFSFYFKLVLSFFQAFTYLGHSAKRRRAKK